MAIYSRPHARSGKTIWWIRFWCRGGCGLHERAARHEERAGVERGKAADLERERVGQVAACAYRDARAPSPEGPTFTEFSERFLKQYAVTRRSDFYASKIRTLDAHFGPRRLATISRADIDLYLVKRGIEVKPGTVRKDAAALSVLFKCAVRWDVLAASPAVGMTRPSEPGHLTRYLTPDEFRRLHAAAPPWLRPVLLLAVTTCLRLKELTNLRWEDYDRAAAVLVIVPDRKVPTVHHVPVNATARQLLEQLPRSIRDPHILRAPRGEGMASETRRKRISVTTRAAMRAAGIERASFHTLRHTGASWMAQAGVPLYQIQRILGHSTPAMTQRYAALSPGNLASAAAALDAALGTRTSGGPPEAENAQQRPGGA